MKVRKKRKKVCIFCADKIDNPDYKDLGRLKKYMSERGKIVPRRASGNCARHQRAVVAAIKKARAIGLLPYVVD